MTSLYETRVKNLGYTPKAMFYATPEQHARKLRLYAEALQAAGSDKSVLDIGCGYGALLEHWEPRGAYLGIDVAEFFVREAARRYPHLDFRVATADSLHEQYDIALLAGVLSSTPSPLTLLRGAARRSRDQILFDITIGERLPAYFKDLNRLSLSKVTNTIEAEGFGLDGVADIGESWIQYRAVRREPGTTKPRR